MSQKITIYDTEEAHNEIGQAIHDAKRRLLDTHKKGVPLQDAAHTFFAECQNVISRAQFRLQTPCEQEAQINEHPKDQNPKDEQLRAARDATIAAAGKINDLIQSAPLAPEPEEKPDTSMVNGYRLLSDRERDHIIESIGEDAGGSFHVGTVILLLEHLVAFHLQGEYPLEGEVMSVSNKLLAANTDAIEGARHALRTDTYSSILHYLREEKESAA